MGNVTAQTDGCPSGVAPRHQEDFLEMRAAGSRTVQHTAAHWHLVGTAWGELCRQGAGTEVPAGTGLWGQYRSGGKTVFRATGSDH